MCACVFKRISLIPYLSIIVLIFFITITMEKERGLSAVKRNLKTASKVDLNLATDFIKLKILELGGN